MFNPLANFKKTQLYNIGLGSKLIVEALDKVLQLHLSKSQV